MKGIITDLDNTLWGGIWVEDGPEKIELRSMYAQYQTLLSKLSDEGVLLAISSKNDDPKFIFDTLKPNITLDKFYPIQANWNDKSISVARILNTWNVFQGDVVFIDDSQFELEEVKSAFPVIKTLKFPKNPADFPEIVRQLREWFPKHTPTEEDKLRMQSIKSGVEFAKEAQAKDPEQFYYGLGAKLTFKRVDASNFDRAVELINKTNQFNMNGWRTDSDAFRNLISFEREFAFTVSYQDKFGDLGIIGVFCGVETKYGTMVSMDHFCLSCRAFNRHIEYAILDFIFRDTECIHFNYQRTDKNGPFVTFFLDLTHGSYFLTKKDFNMKCPRLHFEVKHD